MVSLLKLITTFQVIAGYPVLFISHGNPKFSSFSTGGHPRNIGTGYRISVTVCYNYTQRSIFSGNEVRMREKISISIGFHPEKPGINING